MTSHTTRSFRELLAKLPSRVQRQAREAYRLFSDNPNYPGLHFKQVNADPPMYSARVGISYRAVGAREGDVITWFWIGSHAEYDKLVELL
jgi:hypothetical protein